MTVQSELADGYVVTEDVDSEDITIEGGVCDAIYPEWPQRWPHRWTHERLRQTVPRLTRDVLATDDPPAAWEREWAWRQKIRGIALEDFVTLTSACDGVVVDFWPATPAELPAFLRRQAE